MKIFYFPGHYYLFIRNVFRKPQRFAWFRRQLLYEINSIGINSLPIITIISLFMGAVITIQTAYNIDSPFIPLYAVGLATRDSIILEFSPTIISLILAGKVGSSIASEIGTMRVTEQIDALEIMGINSSSYLVFPKILAAVLINPFLIILSMFLGIAGGWFFGVIAGSVTTTEYLYGIQYVFKPFYVFYALIKTLFFAFIITSISSYFGYYTSGGALEVGSSSTKAVVYSSIFILVANYILTQLLLA
ncbi:MAG TPA: ABC transporter permease [Flavobacteriales bacterium]|nr:ABC transporter permease [Flavobacteriales bacterium]HPH81168.1 ABC transporter permease [Flavobacteriales bacterium]